MCVVCFSGNSDFFIERLKPSKMKSLQDFLSDSVLIFHLEEYYFLRHYKKKKHKNFLYALDNNMHNPCALWPWTLPEIHITGRQLLQTERAALVLTSKTIK